jgi:hypothetical protein
MSYGDLSHLDSATAFTTDSRGRRILVGLTFEETKEHLGYICDRDFGRDRPDQVQRNRELHGKHEVTRHFIVLDRTSFSPLPFIRMPTP